MVMEGGGWEGGTEEGVREERLGREGGRYVGGG